jgi:aspartate carbamoyltransferase catalytic subunit
MALTGRDLISIFDLSDPEIEAIFDLADEMATASRRKLRACDGALMVTLFYEPSTRTRLSFEAAMQRLGGGVLSCADARTTSAAKGETIADTVRVVESYADIIVIRSPLEGAARVAADYAKIPVVNAGDGAHEHPTQTLLDLYTIRKEKGRLRGVKVALVGDLKHARTAHSLAYGLARFGAHISCVAPHGLELPSRVLDRLRTHFGCEPALYRSLDDLVTDPNTLPTSKDRQRLLTSEVMSLFEVIYVTRIQKERFVSPEEFEAAKSSYVITANLLRKARPEALIMHPLPRVDELEYDIDADPRAAYFRQAAYGVPVRMALVAALLGRLPVRIGRVKKGAYKPRLWEDIDLSRLGDVRCENPRCVTAAEAYVAPRFHLVAGRPNAVACIFCGHERDLPEEMT